MGLLMLWFVQAHDPLTWLILAGMALAGGLAQLTLTASLRLAPVALVMPMDYTSLLWAALLGAWLFGQVPTGGTWIGAPIVIASTASTSANTCASDAVTPAPVAAAGAGSFAVLAGCRFRVPAARSSLIWASSRSS
jgi:drug/metabolite transporter (DMT)-like permease